MPVITSSSGCPDLRTGDNCSSTWFEDLENVSFPVFAFLFLYNVLLVLVTFGLLLKQWKQISCGQFLSTDSPSKSKTKFNGGEMVSQNYSKLKKLRLGKNLHQRLVTLVFVGSIFQILCHMIFYLLGSSMKFTFESDVANDDEEIAFSLIQCYAFSFGLCVAFSTSFTTTVLFQKTISCPLASASCARLLSKSPALASLWKLGRFNLVQISSVKDLVTMLLPVWFLFMTAWLFLGIGIIPTPVFFLRVIFGILSVPLVFQGIFLALTGRRIIMVTSELISTLDQQLDHVGRNEALNSYKKMKNRMSIYTKVMEQLLISNGILGLILVSTNVFHEPLGFLVIILMFNFSLAGFATVVIILFMKQKAPADPTQPGQSGNESMNHSREPPSVERSTTFVKNKDKTVRLEKLI